MRMAVYFKHLGVAALALGMAVGCATTQQPQAEEAQACSPDLIDEMNASIQEADSLVNEARSMGAEWRDADSLVREAEAARDDCRVAESLAAAQEAKYAAQDAMSAYGQGQAQPEPMDNMQGGDTHDYTVSRGDTLWGIAGSSVGYNDPYQWPLIFRANATMLDDPDLIYPGQQLAIENDPSSEAVDAAVKHAKTRGAWSVGEQEYSDQLYLMNNW